MRPLTTVDTGTRVRVQRGYTDNDLPIWERGIVIGPSDERDHVYVLLRTNHARADDWQHSNGAPVWFELPLWQLYADWPCGCHDLDNSTEED